MHGIDPVAGAIVWTSDDVVTPYATLSADGSFSFYPGIDTIDDLVCVPDPETGELVALAVETGEIVDRIVVGGQPARVTAISVSGIEHWARASAWCAPELAPVHSDIAHGTQAQDPSRHTGSGPRAL